MNPENLVFAIYPKEHQMEAAVDELLANDGLSPISRRDISVVFEEADVIHVGDTWWNGIYPFIDYSTGGSIDGTIGATERNLSVRSG